jgi:hypothetical protein
MEFTMVPNENQTVSESPGKSRKRYTKPHLENLGDLRSLTLGGSPGAGESGGFSRKVFTGLQQNNGIPMPGIPPLPGEQPLPGQRPFPGEKRLP